MPIEVIVDRQPIFSDTEVGECVENATDGCNRSGSGDGILVAENGLNNDRLAGLGMILCSGVQVDDGGLVGNNNVVTDGDSFRFW